MERVATSKRKAGLRQRDVKNWIFIAVMAAIPMVQFAIFYIYVNFNTVLMSFQSYEINESTGLGKYVWNNFANFKEVWRNVADTKILLVGLKNSTILYAVSTLIGTPLSLFFSYYIYKKRPLHKTFKIMLFLPSIISSLVMTLLFQYFVNFSIPDIWKKVFGKTIEGLTSPATKSQLPTILFYCVWVSFGTSMLMYSGAMNNISESMVEACHLDGANNLQEFWYVTLPGVFPTLTTFLTTSIAAFFTADMSLFAFYGEGAEAKLYTVGYYIFVQTKKAGLADYPYLASLGLVLTIIAMPFTFGLRKLLFRFGPSTER